MREGITQEAYQECVRMADKSYYTADSLIRFTSSEVKELQERIDIEEAKPKKTKRVLEGIDAARQAMGTRLVKARKLTARQKFLDQRLDHAMRRLKERGLWADNIEGLMALCEENNMLRERGLLQALQCTTGSNILDVAKKGELDETCWRIGIELAMLLHEPDLCESDNMFGPVLGKYLPDIFMLTIMAAYGCKISRALESDDYGSALIDMIADKYLQDDRVLGSLSGMLEQICAESGEQEEQLESANRTIEKLRGEVQSLRAIAAAQRDSASKRLAPIQSRLEKLEDKNRDLARENDELRSKNETLSAELSGAYQKISELSAQTSQDVNDLPELPSSNVIFVGGHINMVKKFANDHPGWQFIDSDDKIFPRFKKPTVIFFWTKHLGHTTYHRAKAFAPPDTPLCYLTSTNIEMLELEMRRAWAAVRPVEPDLDTE